MPGERPEKFANLRLTFGHMIMHPGRKLLFMGQDIGEFDEWNENREVEWELLQYPEHQGLNRLMADLNRMYREKPALYALDSDKDGFEWINSISANECVLVFLRKSEDPAETLLVVENFANVERKNYKIGVPFAGKYKEILSTDMKVYGGQGISNPRVKESKPVECDDREQSIQIRMAPLSVHVFSCTPYTQEELLELKKIEVEKQMEELKKEMEKKEAEKAALEKKASAKKAVKSEKAEDKKASQKKATAKKAPQEKAQTKKTQKKEEK